MKYVSLNPRYSSLRTNIAQKYVDIEKQLGSKFTEAIQSSDVKRMRLYASTLQNFQTVYIRFTNGIKRFRFFFCVGFTAVREGLHWSPC